LIVDAAMSAREAWLRWRDGRERELRGPESWFGVVGLFCLEPGRNVVGSDPAATVVLPAGPAHLGELEWASGAVTWHPDGGKPQVLDTDIASRPTAVDHENLSFFIVDRDGRLAARVRDRDWAAQRPFAGISCYDYDPAWRFEAAWVALDTPLALEVPNVSGELKRVSVTHRAVFSVAGTDVALVPTIVGDGQVFFPFRDRTSGRATYGAGRFLYAPAPADGGILLDFNFAFTPPCAFTPFATCPLPPPENWLPFELPAGEQYGGKAA
jgi:uncharacterized protein (DUF1684 family)